MKIRVLSDLHVDLNERYPLELDNKEIFTIVAGDTANNVDTSIDWIQKNKAEEANFVVQYRDGGGDYTGTEEPYLIFVKHGLRYERDGKLVADTRTILL